MIVVEMNRAGCLTHLRQRGKSQSGVLPGLLDDLADLERLEREDEAGPRHGDLLGKLTAIAAPTRRRRGSYASENGMQRPAGGAGLGHFRHYLRNNRRRRCGAPILLGSITTAKYARRVLSCETCPVLGEINCRRPFGTYDSGKYSAPEAPVKGITDGATLTAAGQDGSRSSAIKRSSAVPQFEICVRR